MRGLARRFVGDRSGATSIETGVLTVVVVAMFGIGWKSVGQRVKTKFDTSIEQAFSLPGKARSCRDPDANAATCTLD